MPKSYKRGYAVAVLLGMDIDHAVLWDIFSQVAKQQQIIPLSGGRSDAKATYSFHESIVNALRPTLREGVRSVIIASPSRTSYAQEFLNHVKAHHTWLVSGANKAAFSTMVGSASTPQQVAALTKTTAFKELISQTTAEETEGLLEILEKKLNAADNLVLFSLQEAESIVLYPQGEEKPKPEYLMLTDEFLSKSRQKNRLQRLMQVAANKGVKTRVISAESAAGLRIAQLGGIVCLAKRE